MYNVAIRMVRNPTDAEDVLQETFLKVFQQLHQFRGQSTIGAWIKQITVRTALNYLRRKKETVDINLQLHATEEKMEEGDGAYNVKAIHEAIKALPKGCRTIVNLHLVEGYQHKEIAQILRISESTSKSQYHRGKKILRTILKKSQKNKIINGYV